MAWKHLPTKPIDIPEQFIPDTLSFVRRLDGDKPTAEDEIALLEVLVAYATGNLSKEEVCEALSIDISDLRFHLRASAQNGMEHAGKEGTPTLRLTGFSTLQQAARSEKELPIEVVQAEQQSEAQQPARPQAAPRPDRLQQLLSSSGLMSKKED